MRITAIDTYLLESKLDRPFGWSQGWIDRRTIGLVKITTDAGFVGWGEGCGGSAFAVVSDLAPLLLGRDPMQRNRLWQVMYGALHNGNVGVGFGGSAISAVDIALWDIAGKVTGLPIHELLGGRIRDKLAVYATGLYYTEGEFPDRLLDEARGYVEAGYKGMKTKVGGLPVEEDVRRVAAIREAIGPDIELMVDANQAYNAATAIRIGRRLADLDIFWFEEPVPTLDVDGCLQVKAALPMAIAGGEVLRTRYEYRNAFLRGCFDIIQPDVGNVGGITRNAQCGHDGQRLRRAGQPARLGLVRHDRSHPACSLDDPALPARARPAAVRAGAGHGVRPHAQRHPRRVVHRRL